MSGGTGTADERGDLTGLLRWYPPAWRTRYGPELVALMEDDLEGGRPTVRFRTSMAVSGLRQRARSAGVAGHGSPPGVRVRAGALVVLASWTALVLGGAAFAKLSEHYSDATLAEGHGVAVAAYDAVLVLAVTGLVLVLAGVAVATPAAWRFLRAGGWPAVRRPMVVAAVLSVTVVIATVGLGHWAHHLTVHARNGGNAVYSGAFLAWAVLVAAVLATWTGAGTAVARRLDLGPTSLRIEAGLAFAVAVVVGVTAAMIGLWWVAMARGASWYLAGTRPGTHPSAVTAPLVILMGWLAVATAVALYGAVRVGRSVRAV